MRSPSSAFLCTFLVVFGYGASEYLEDRPELLKVYHKYRSSHPPKKLIPVGEELYHSDLNATMEYSKGFSGIYTEVEQSIYERVNPEVEKWSITLTSSTIGEDEDGKVDEADVIDYYETVFDRANGYYWALIGDGILYARGEEDYEEAGDVSISGSGHAIYAEGNTSRIVYEVYQVIDYEDGSETTLTYGDLITNATEGRLKTKGFETSQVVEEGKDDLLPVQVNSMESDEPLDGEGDVSEAVDGKVFSEDDDVTFNLDGEGKMWTTHILPNEHYSKKALRHAVRSAISRLLLKSKNKSKRR